MALNIGGGDCASNDSEVGQLTESSAKNLQRAVRAVISEAEGQFANAGIVVHVVEDVILQAVASPSTPSTFTTRFGGAPVALLDELAPNLAEAARQRRPVFEYDTAIASVLQGDSDGATTWASLATTAVFEDDAVVGFVEVMRTTNDRPDDHEYAFHQEVAQRVRQAIASASDDQQPDVGLNA